MIRRLATMGETVDVKAGIKHILERIEAASSKRPAQVEIEKDFLFCFIIFLFLVRQRSAAGGRE